MEKNTPTDGHQIAIENGKRVGTNTGWINSKWGILLVEGKWTKKYPKGSTIYKYHFEPTIN